MRIAHAADIHLGHRQYGLKQRETDIRLSFQHFLSQAHERETDAILIPGDLFDSRDITFSGYRVSTNEYRPNQTDFDIVSRKSDASVAS